MKDKTELKAKLNATLDEISEAIVRDMHNISIAQSNINGEISKIGPLLDVLVEEILDTHTFFEKFAKHWNDGCNVQSIPEYQSDLEFLKKRYDHIVEYIEKFAGVVTSPST